MKIRNLLNIGAATLAAIALNAAAADALLSPRAVGNQIKHVSGTANEAKPIGSVTASVPPRAAGNQLTKVTGTNNGVNPATLCARHMTAGSNATQTCAANLANMPCCCVSAGR